MSLSNESNNDHIQQIVDRNIPFVMFDKISKLCKCSKVIIDDQKQRLMAVQHLIDNGCKKLLPYRAFKPQMLLTVTLVTKSTRKKTIYHLTQN
jgi:DNA-binding LacI/PurR family transcriptional regulator